MVAWAATLAWGVSDRDATLKPPPTTLARDPRDKVRRRAGVPSSWGAGAPRSKRFERHIMGPDVQGQSRVRSLAKCVTNDTP